MKKAALYDNPSGYGHGGLGYDTSLDAMPPAPPRAVPTWLPWAALAGAGVLGYAGLRGAGRLFRRAPKTPTFAPGEAGKLEMLGRADPKVERRLEEAMDAMVRRRHGLGPEPGAKAGTGAAARSKTSAVLISTLGRIARGE